MNTEKLKDISNNLRVNIIEMLAQARSGHPGRSLSMADILTVLYFEKMNVNSKEAKWEDRDRLVLSKGYRAAALYAVLAEEEYFPKEE